MFKLFNGKKIDEEGIIKALGGNERDKKHFLDSLSGEVIIAKNKSTTSELENKQRYFLIPEVGRDKQLEGLKNCATEVMSREDEKIFEILLKALRQGKTYDECVEIVKRVDDSWFYGWDSWRGDCLYDETLDWLAGLPIKIKEEHEYFDDCPICRAMKEADEEGRSLTEPELKEPFKKAKDKGAAVGEGL